MGFTAFGFPLSTGLGCAFFDLATVFALVASFALVAGFSLVASLLV
jgi:hypothetical protein